LQYDGSPDADGYYTFTWRGKDKMLYNIFKMLEESMNNN
jgi:hypothetical protein